MIIAPASSSCPPRPNAGPAMTAPSLIAFLSVATAAIGIASAAPLLKAPAIELVEMSVVPAQRVEIAAPTARITRMFVEPGQRIEVGDLIAGVDTSAIDRQIEELRRQGTAVQRRLEAVRLEAQSIGVLVEQQLTSRARLDQLEEHLRELETSALQLQAAVGTAEQQLAAAEIRAPIAGVVSSITDVSAEGHAAPERGLAVIDPDQGRLLIEGRLPSHVVAAIGVNGAFRVWTGPDALTRRERLGARLVWPSQPPAGGQPEAVSRMIDVRLELVAPTHDQASRLGPGHRVAVAVETGSSQQVWPAIDTLCRTIRVPCTSMLVKE